MLLFIRALFHPHTQLPGRVVCDSFLTQPHTHWFSEPNRCGDPPGACTGTPPPSPFRRPYLSPVFCRRFFQTVWLRGSPLVSRPAPHIITSGTGPAVLPLLLSVSGSSSRRREGCLRAPVLTQKSRSASSVGAKGASHPSPSLLPIHPEPGRFPLLPRTGEGARWGTGLSSGAGIPWVFPGVSPAGRVLLPHCPPHCSRAVPKLQVR